jgi:hypothetical protein
VLEATLALYPGSRPRRALVVGEPTVRAEPGSCPEGGTLDDALADLAAAWAENPWGARVPVVLAEAALLPPADGAAGSQVVDAGGAAVPLLADTVPWLALALTGGRPAALVGELERTGFRVLSVQIDGGLVAV